MQAAVTEKTSLLYYSIYTMVYTLHYSIDIGRGAAKVRGAIKRNVSEKDGIFPNQGKGD